MNRRVQWSEQGEGSTGGAGLEPQSLSDLQTLRPNPPKQTGFRCFGKYLNWKHVL